jgi:hypothetical protein
MNKAEKIQLHQVIAYVLEAEAGHYEETAEAYGEDSEAAKNHIYAKAREIWAAFELDSVTFEGHKPKRVFSVWVGGSEVNDFMLTETEAENIAADYRFRGYDDVQIERVTK